MLQIRLVAGADFREIPMENEPLISTFRRVRRFPGVAAFALFSRFSCAYLRARVLLCRESPSVAL